MLKIVESWNITISFIAQAAGMPTQQATFIAIHMFVCVIK
jgi:hypothetical protein